MLAWGAALAELSACGNLIQVRDKTETNHLGDSITTQDSVTTTHEIRLDGELLIKGDSSSIGVILKNLNGDNFIDRPAHSDPDSTHANYLVMVERDWQCELKSGGVLTLHVDGAAEALRSHAIQR